jgi:diguanylate cyclase (GGDEF)-like protein
VPEPLGGAGEIGQLGAAFTNMARAIGEREERIRHQAGRDTVTDLPNRLAADADIQRVLLAEPSRPGALLLIGLSRLPEITKTMGHAISDRLMHDAAQRARLPAGAGTMARVGDSELSVWLPGADKSAAISAAFRILNALAEPYREADVAIDTAPAAGIALFPAHGAQASGLMQRAEVALFAALGSADAVAVYDPATDPHRPERLILMAELRTAVERDELRLHYQPKVNLATGAIDGAEGLVRWQHPKRGPIAPDAFIGLAEETGNIRRLTRWVLAAGVAQAQLWRARGWDLRVAVNVSARDLDDVDLPRRVGELLSAHGIPARHLAIEITESAVMARPDAAMQVLRRLSELGVDLAIDDFGIGQSSFAYLHRLPVRELKIDRTFVKDLSRNIEDQAIVRSIVELGQRLGYRVTAEGVEDAVALEYLTRVGCHHAQGFHIAAALPAGMFDVFAEKRMRPGTVQGLA